MGAGATSQHSAAPGADHLAQDGPDLIGQRCIGISAGSLALGGGEVFVGDQRGIALCTGVLGVFQDPLHHVFVPRRGVLVVAGALPGHVLRDSQKGGPGQVLAEDVPHCVGLLGMRLGDPALDYVAEGNFSLPCHGLHQPFRQLQPVEEPELHFLR